MPARGLTQTWQVPFFNPWYVSESMILPDLGLAVHNKYPASAVGVPGLNFAQQQSEGFSSSASLTGPWGKAHRAGRLPKDAYRGKSIISILCLKFHVTGWQLLSGLTYMPYSDQIHYATMGSVARCGWRPTIGVIPRSELRISATRLRLEGG